MFQGQDHGGDLGAGTERREGKRGLTESWTLDRFSFISLTDKSVLAFLSMTTP
jgi:hypothetical protein